MHSRVKLNVLCGQTAFCTESWETTVEKLAISLSRDRFCVVSVPELYSVVFKAALLAIDTPQLAPLPGCSATKYRGGGENYIMNACCDGLELAARSVLQGVCRSNLIRLRSDTFNGILDDLPLPKSHQSSSVLTLQEYIDNYQQQSSASHCEEDAIFPDPQEETSDMGLLSIIVPREAQDKDGRQLSVLQVKDATGKWRDVVVGAGEVVVIVGRTMRHLTAGVLTPTVYRVAGNPFGCASGGGPRRVLHFELLPRPFAVLDFHKQLQEAGHDVSPQYAGPASIETLMQRFGGQSTPGQPVRTPGNTEGTPAVLTFGGGSVKPRRRKRSSEAAELAVSLDRCPTTRGMRRAFFDLVSERNKQDPAGRQPKEQGLEGDASEGGSGQGAKQASGRSGSAKGKGSSSRRQQQRQPQSTCLQGDDEKCGGKSVGRSLSGAGGLMEGPGRGGLMVVKGRTCTVLESVAGGGGGPRLTLCLKSCTGVERWFYVPRAFPCGRLFEVYCDRMGLGLGAVKFTFKGKRVFGADKLVGMKDGDELMVEPESQSRLQQDRQLRPLHRGLLGTEPEEEEPI